MMHPDEFYSADENEAIWEAVSNILSLSQLMADRFIGTGDMYDELSAHNYYADAVRLIPLGYHHQVTSDGYFRVISDDAPSFVVAQFAMPDIP